MSPVALVAPTAPRIEFDPVAHAYRVDGRPVASVTQILGAVLGNDFERIDAAVLADAMARGTAVHYACELDDGNDLDYDGLHPRVRPYVDQYRRFKVESGATILAVERQLYNAAYNYVGTSDRKMIVNRKRATVDIKTGVKSPKAALQTAGYALAEEVCHEAEPIEARYSLHLTPDSYELVPHKDPNDRAVFLSVCNVYHWKKRNLK